MVSSLALVIVVGVQAAPDTGTGTQVQASDKASDKALDKDVFKSANAKNPASLAEQYVEQLPKVGVLLPNNVLRDKVRRDLMPRLMATENDRAAYELALDAYEKFNSRSHSLVELSSRVAKSERIRTKDRKEIEDVQEETSLDLNFLTKKIQEGEGSSSPVTFDALKLMANSIQSYACAYAVTEKTVVKKGLKDDQADIDINQDCSMPFPGSFVMLNRKVAVPEQITINLPDEHDKDCLHPETWMVQHLRRKMWCPSAVSITCDAISSALAIPTSDEIAHERDALAHSAGTMQEDPQPAVAEMAAPRVLMEGTPEKKQALTPGDLIRQQLQANKKKKLTLLKKIRAVQKEKLDLINSGNEF